MNITKSCILNSFKFFFLAVVSLLFLNSCEQEKKDTNKSKVSIEKTYLKGLTIASQAKANEQNVVFDGMSIPVYNDAGHKVQGMEMMELMVSGEYKHEYYMDENGVIKLIALRKSTEAERQDRETVVELHELVGKDAWPFEVTDLDGNMYSLENLKGKIIVMNHWFVECKPCIIEMPDLNKLVEKYKGDKVQFIGISTSSEKKIESFLEKQIFNYAIIPDSKEVSDRYQVSSFPSNIVIDQKGKIAYYSSGLSKNTIEHIKDTIQSLLK